MRKDNLFHVDGEAGTWVMLFLYPIPFLLWSFMGLILSIHFVVVIAVLKKQLRYRIQRWEIQVLDQVCQRAVQLGLISQLFDRVCWLLFFVSTSL